MVLCRQMAKFNTSTNIKVAKRLLQTIPFACYNYMFQNILLYSVFQLLTYLIKLFTIL